MALIKGYCIRWVVYHTECAFHTNCVVVVAVGDVVVETEVVRNCWTSRESMKPLDTYLSTEGKLKGRLRGKAHYPLWLVDLT